MDQQPAHDYRDDEIDLFELFVSLWKEKVIIVAITILTTLVGGGYAFLVKPTYEVRVKLNAEASEAVEILKTLSFGESLSVTVDNYVQFIESPEFQEALYQQGFLDRLFEDEEFDTPNDALRLIPEVLYTNVLGDKKTPSIYPYEVVLEASDPLAGENALNQILSLADAQLSFDAQGEYDNLKAARIDKLLKDKLTLEAELLAKRNDEITRLVEADDLQRADLTEQLRIKTESYFENLSDRIKSLEEAVGIAKSLGIVEPVALDRLVRKNDTVAANQVFEVVSNSKEDPLYMRGTRLLTAELEQLKNRPKDFIPDNEIKKLRDELEALKVNHKVETLKSRESDESFSEKLQAIRAELARLKVEQFPSNLSFKFANGKAISGDRPVKPKKLLILALSVFIGCFIGIVVALFVSTSKKRKLA
jgi:chain length determinant protein (polysaccharide antigen chain regulator)